MLRFPKGIITDVQEQQFQDWRDSHAQGLVVTRTPTRKGGYTVHRATCRTIWYPLAEAKQSLEQKKRSPRVCLVGRPERFAWTADEEDYVVLVESNHCSRCHP